MSVAKGAACEIRLGDWEGPVGSERGLSRFRLDSNSPKSGVRAAKG